jgi:hypothetical protein
MGSRGRGIRILGVLVAAISIGGVVFSVVSYYANRPLNQIDAVTLSYVEFEPRVIDIETGHTVELQVLFDGDPVEDLKQMVIEIRNSGNQVLRQADNPVLYLEFPTSVKILTLDIGEKPEPEMQFSAAIDSDEHRVNIEIGLLKTEESVPIAIFLAGEVPDGYPLFEGRSLAKRRALSGAELIEKGKLGVPSYIYPLMTSVVATALVAFILQLWSMMFPGVKLRRRSASGLLFQNSGTSIRGWERIGEKGEVVLAVECPGQSQPCLRKQTAGDPNGGFKLLEKTIERGFIFSGWIYHPAEQPFGPADRLAVEDSTFCGYGFCLTDSCKNLWIERRVRKAGKPIKKRYVDLNCDTWYKFSLYVEQSDQIHLHIYDDLGTEVASITEASEETYREFDRVCIHGGGPYYVRDLRIEKK